MQVHRDLQQLPAFRNAVITIGTFDGVHYGHKHIIQQLKQAAQACGGESVVVTFDPHPREVLMPGDTSVRLLTTLEEKIELLSQEQVDHLVVVPFTKAFSELSAQAYLENFLIQRFNPHTIIIGYDHRFGHNREGGLHLLEAEQNKYGFCLIEIPQQVVDDLTVSSTKIRNSLKVGDITLANELLGYPYFLGGTVIHGDKMGRQLGFPTANIGLNDPRKLIPAQGVYAVKVFVGEERRELNGVLNIGTRPTFNGKELRIEVHIFDFNEDIYDQPIRVAFMAYQREDRKYDNIDALVSQIREDAYTAREILGIA
ncbi:riboflavin kinase/FMN adenylyltransferase [Chitinophaga skermanii]|uniref:Riboflavin biosynthesis protein n=1 Tax=Chitinophaga skermanii TaxID=331697 RepID=A0A327QFX5_9BACT|nr:bifunctional riboflavin kinase/FAD synthetase [Chitinophaga skermanii]RAJ02532.1 riboflavin kinase/FMN adenylyltransferase [Chitinophaga skermanii]